MFGRCRRLEAVIADVLVALCICLTTGEVLDPIHPEDFTADVLTTFRITCDSTELIVPGKVVVSVVFSSQSSK